MPKQPVSSKKKANDDHTDQEDIIEDLFTKPDSQLYRRASMTRTVVTAGIVSAFIGVIAGVVGVLLILSGTLERAPFFKSFTLESILPERQVIIRPQQAVTVTQEQHIREVATRVRGSVVTFVTPHVAPRETGTSAPDTQSVYTDDDVLGFGVILSSDGWLVTLDEVLGKRVLDEVLVLSSAGKPYTLSGRIIDGATGIAFLKIDADGLRAASFAESPSIASGSDLLTLTARLPQLKSVVDRVAVASLSDTPTIQSSEVLAREVIVSSVDQRIVAPVFNMAGEVVGFQHGIYSDGASQQAYVRPVYHISSQINQVLSIQDIIRPILGVTWIDLNGNPGLSDTVRQGFTKGAYIVTVEEGSAAAVAGIQSGDVLQSVNDIEVNGTLTFSEIVQQFGPSDRVIIAGSRAGEQQEFDVTLDTIQTTNR